MNGHTGQYSLADVAVGCLCGCWILIFCGWMEQDFRKGGCCLERGWRLKGCFVVVRKVSFPAVLPVVMVHNCDAPYLKVLRFYPTRCAL